MKLEITYAAGLQPSASTLSMLAIFYDKIYLPYPYGVSPDSRRIWGNWESKFADDHEYVEKCYQRWRDDQALYFQEQVVETLPDLFDQPGRVGEAVADELIARFGIGHLDNYRFTREELASGRVRFNKNFILDGKLAMALHFAYAERRGPDFFWGDDRRVVPDWDRLCAPPAADGKPDTSTENLTRLLLSALAHELPIFKVRSPEEVLELREKFREERRALACTLAELTDSLEKRLGGNSQPEEAALKVIERELTPKFEEFRRQLPGDRGAWAGKVTNVVLDIAKIEAGIMSPRFYFELGKVLLGAAGMVAERDAKMNTNRALTFRFLAHLAK